MFTINYVLLKGKRQWLRRWLRPSLLLPRLLQQPEQWRLQQRRLLFHQLLQPLRQQHQPLQVAVLVQPQFRLLAQEQATAR
jgi:hypothetical protein